MTKPASIFDVADADAEAQAIARAEAEIDDGKGVPHERVRAWLLRLAKGEIMPPPSA
jgi:predicted transcriptional regulator